MHLVGFSHARRPFKAQTGTTHLFMFLPVSITISRVTSGNPPPTLPS